MYAQQYQKSIADREGFWGEAAEAVLRQEKSGTGHGHVRSFADELPVSGASYVPVPVPVPFSSLLFDVPVPVPVFSSLRNHDAIALVHDFPC